jgi:nitrile hydratase accessory protein
VRPYTPTFGSSTLSQYSQKEDVQFGHLPEPPEADGVVFAAPWEAEAFALALTLSSQRLYSWREWTEVLAGEIARGEGADKTPNGAGYYLHWLAALERIAIAKGIVDEKALDIRKRQWNEAFGSTPHGQPVELRSV